VIKVVPVKIAVAAITLSGVLTPYFLLKNPARRAIRESSEITERVLIKLSICFDSFGVNLGNPNNSTSVIDEI